MASDKNGVSFKAEGVKMQQVRTTNEFCFHLNKHYHIPISQPTIPCHHEYCNEHNLQCVSISDVKIFRCNMPTHSMSLL